MIAGLEPGIVLGDMTIVALRRRGGFAQLYEARRGATGGRVAIKLLLPHLAMTRPRAIDRLRLEASLLRQLDHPHVVEMLDYGEYRGFPYLAMEWLDGRTLADELAERGALSQTTTLGLFEQLVDALDAVHARGVVHRDLSPANVMLVADREPIFAKLIDFGIAKVVRDGPGITTSLEILGTPVAMSPEQLLGAPIDARTDVYGLGALLFHCLPGRPPFAGRTSVETEELHLSADPPRASDTVPVARAVDLVIQRAMSKSPAARHANARLFLADLRDSFAERPARRRGAAIYVDARAASSDDDLASLDAALLDAHRTLRAAGFEVLAEVGDAILAGSSLPGDGVELRRLAISVAAAIATPRMCVELRVAVDAYDGVRSHLGPEALAGRKPGVFVSEEVLASAPELAGSVTGTIVPGGTARLQHTS